MSEVRRNEARENETSQTLGGSNCKKETSILSFPDAPESWKRELVRSKRSEEKPKNWILVIQLVEAEAQLGPPL